MSVEFDNADESTVCIVSVAPGAANCFMGKLAFESIFL